jgi:Cdc6-like AAA superfamily ATPase
MAQFTTQPHPLTRKLGALDQQIGTDVDQPIPRSSPWTWYIVGGRGSGKTSLLLNVLKHHLKGHFDTITLISKTYKNDIQTKKDLRRLVEELEEDGRVHQTLTEDLATDIIEEIEAFNEGFDRKKNKRAPRHLVIMDDQLSELPRGRMRSRINDLVVNGRHLNTSLIVLTQKYRSLPTTWRSNMQLLSFYSAANKKEVDSLIEDLNVDPDELRAKYEFATKGPKHFLHLNSFGSKPLMFKNFDLIINAV